MMGGGIFRPLKYANSDDRIHVADILDSAEKVLKEDVVPCQLERYSIVKAIAEDNIRHRITIALTNGMFYSFNKSDNVFLSFSFADSDNNYIISSYINFCVGTNNLSALTPYVFDLSHLKARFTTSPGCKVYVGNKEQVSGISENDFSTGVDYRIIAQDGQENYYHITIRNTGLPIVFITTPENKEISSKSEWMGNVTIKVINNSGLIECCDSLMQIKGRGNSTWGYPKKPYSLKLNKKTEILGMPKNKHWILLANWLDRTLMRNEFAFEIARITSLEWTPHGRFVELVLNGKHVGNYYLCEKITIDKNRVNISEMSKGDTVGLGLTGGYIVELDVNFDEQNKFLSEYKNLPYMIKEPDEKKLQSAQLNYIQNYINCFERFLYSDNWLYNHDYIDYIDLKSFVDWWFVYELSMNEEPFHPKSCYMYKDRGGKIKAGPVWDFDWGTFIPSRVNRYVAKDHIYYKRLFEDPEFNKMIKNRWALLKPEFEKIPNKIRNKALLIRYSEKMNHLIWPVTFDVNGDANFTFDKALNRMIEAYNSKLKWLDFQISFINSSL